MKNVSRNDQHHDRQAGQHARIDHRRLDLALQVLLARAEFGDLGQHHIQEAARLARPHHRDVDRRKRLGMLRQRIGQRSCPPPRRRESASTAPAAPEIWSRASRCDSARASGHAAGQQAGHFPREILDMFLRSRGPFLSPTAAMPPASFDSWRPSPSSPSMPPPSPGESPLPTTAAIAAARESAGTVPLTDLPFGESAVYAKVARHACYPFC